MLIAASRQGLVKLVGVLDAFPKLDDTVPRIKNPISGLCECTFYKHKIVRGSLTFLFNLISLLSLYLLVLLQCPSFVEFL